MSCGHGVGIDITSEESKERRHIRIFDSYITESPEGSEMEVPAPFNSRGTAADMEALVNILREGKLDGITVGEHINGLL